MANHKRHVNLPAIARHFDRPHDRPRAVRRSLVSTLPLALLAPWAVLPARAQDRTRGALAALPAPVEQRFQVFYGDMSRNLVVAEVFYRLQHEAGRYEASTRGHAVGVVALFYAGNLIQNSVGSVGPEGLRPERYGERRGKRAERVIRFDYGRQKMIGNGDPAEVPLLPGTQDRLSVFYQLGLMARGQPKQFERGRKFVLPLAGMKKIDEPVYTVAGPEAVMTSRGPIPALRVTARNEADPEDPTIDCWLGVQLSMLPARIRVQQHDGKVIDQVLLPAD